MLLGLIVDFKEMQELEYLLKREMDELLFDFEDSRIDNVVKKAMEERYQILFNLYRRIASPVDCAKYMRQKKEYYP